MGTTLIKAEYQSLIFEIRGYKVMIDTDLAALYETETMTDFRRILCFN